MARRIGTPGGTPERPAIFFKDAAEFGRWLAAHHDTETELWMGFYRKGHPTGRAHLGGRRPRGAVLGLDRQHGAGHRRAHPPPALDPAQTHQQLVDDQHQRRRRAHRRRAGCSPAAWPRSSAAAKTAPASTPTRTASASCPPHYAAQLAADPAATAFWEVATPSYRKLAVNWVVTAKQEKTRDARMAQLVDDCADGRMIPSQRYGIEPKWVQRAAAAAEAARLG